MRHTPCGCCPPDRAAGAGRFCLFVQTRRGGRRCPPDRTQRARGTIQPLFLCAAKKKPLAVKRKRQRGICVGTNFTSLTLPQAAGLVRFVVPPFPTRIASLDSRGSPAFAIPLKTTKKRADAPFLDYSRGLVCTKHISNRQNAMQMRIRKPGEVVEILCASFDFHTSNIQRARTGKH